MTAQDLDLVTRWLTWQEHSKGSSTATVDKYLGYLQQLVAFLEERGGIGLLQADLSVLEAFTGIEAHNRGLTPRSRQPLVAAVRGFYAWCVRAGLLDKSPAASIAYPRYGRPLPSRLSLSNAEKLLMAPGVRSFIGVRDTAILAVFIGAGLRLSGVVALNESSLKWYHEGEREHLVLQVREKGSVERLVPVDDHVRLLVRAYLGHPELDRIDRLLEDGDRVLFCSLINTRVPAHEFRGERRRLSGSAIQQMIVRYGEQVGVPRTELHVHAARHLYGTELAEDATDLLRIQALMGHRDPKTTAEYVRLAVRALGETVRKSAPTAKIKTPASELVEALRNTKKR